MKEDKELDEEKASLSFTREKEAKEEKVEVEVIKASPMKVEKQEVKVLNRMGDSLIVVNKKGYGMTIPVTHKNKEAKVGDLIEI